MCIRDSRRMADTGDAISADINLLIEVLTAPRPRTMPVPGPRYEPMPSAPDEYGMPIIQ